MLLKELVGLEPLTFVFLPRDERAFGLYQVVHFVVMFQKPRGSAQPEVRLESPVNVKYLIVRYLTAT